MHWADKFKTPTAVAIAKVLTDKGLIEPGEEVAIERVYAGRHQRSCGAWSWFAENRSGVSICGSQWPAKEVIRLHNAGLLGVHQSPSTFDIDLYPIITKEARS